MLLCLTNIVSFQCAQLHSKVTSDWSMATLHMKEELKCATMDGGVQCVMTAGVEMMLELFASSLDSLHGVSCQQESSSYQLLIR